MSATPPPPVTPPARRPDGEDPARTRVGRRLMWQSAALLGMVLTFTLALPWKLVSPALAVVALVLGALVWSGSRGVDRSGSSRAAAGAGSALALVGLTVGLLPALLWNETAAFERCTGSAVTVRAQHECAREFTRVVEERTGVAQLGG